MNCKKIKRKLGSFLDKELEKKERISVKQHLKQCLHCGEEAKILSQIQSSLKEWKDIEPSPDFEANFWKKLALEKEKGPSFRWLHLLPRPIIIALALVILPLAGLLFVRSLLPGSLLYHRAELIEVEARQQYLASLGLNSFKDFFPHSVGRIYFSLISEENMY
ncbi:MAG: anti-sigma factor family protein [bacterium]